MHLKVSSFPFHSKENWNAETFSCVINGGVSSAQIHSDSDIQLDATGSFKRFDPVDKDFKMTYATTSLGGINWGNEDKSDIPPQPLRPAPAPLPPPPTREAPKLPSNYATKTNGWDGIIWSFVFEVFNWFFLPSQEIKVWI